MAHCSGTHTWSKTWTRWSALSIHVQCYFLSIETATSTFTQPPSSEWCTERNAACFITINYTHTSNTWPTHTRSSYIRNNKCDTKAAVFVFIKTAVDWNHLVNAAAVYAQSEKSFKSQNHFYMNISYMRNNTTKYCSIPSLKMLPQIAFFF